MDMSARRAVSWWVPMTESYIHTMRLLVAAGSDLRYGCQLAAMLMARLRPRNTHGVICGISFPGHEIPFNCKDVWGSLLCQALHFRPCLKKITCQG
jgi:hypothetical protein